MNHSTTIAPSEAHLEEWVYKNPTQFGEYDEDGDWQRYMDFILDQQYALPSGIADFVGRTRLGAFPLCAVELKKGEIDSRALAQVLRYMSNLSEFVEIIRQSHYMRNRYSHEDLHALYWRRHVSGLLVGHRIEDQNLLIACAKCDVHVVLYTYNGEGYVFRQIKDPMAMQKIDDRFIEAHMPLVYTTLDVLEERMRQVRKWSTR